MMAKKILKLTLLTFLIGTIIPTHAQVTIGSGETPLDGALLQLKEKEGVTDESENSTKGLVFPRVKLTQKDKLYPMLAKADGSTPLDSYKNATDIATMNKTHVGLTVYNTNTTAPFKLGLYTWNGIEWKDYGGDISALNGLTNNTTTQTIELGGNLTKATTITQGANNLTFDAGTSNFEINTTGAGKVAINTNTVVVSGNNVAIGGTPQSNAALKIDATDKGFILPRVELADGNDKTKVPVGTADKGLVVYHTGNLNLEEGIYSWNGTSWNQLISRLPPDTDANIKEILSEISLPRVPGATTYTSASKLPFDKITIPEDGTFAFAIRMAGKLSKAGAIPIFFYLKPLRENSSGILEPIETADSGFTDGQTFYSYTSVDNGSVGATVYLVARKCKAGDVIELYASSFRGNSNTLGTVTLYKDESPKPSRTSVVFWKL